MIKAFADLDYGISIGGEIQRDNGLITGNISEMNNLLDRLHDNALLYGLKINTKKTKVMLVGEHTNTNDVVHIKNTPIDIVTVMIILQLHQESAKHGGAYE